MTWNSRIQGKKAVPGKGSQTELIEEAVEILEEAVEKNAVFLWTGGKEAQVIADLLLYTVGENDEDPQVPFGVIDTGNQFEEMYDFRENYIAADGDQGADTVGPFSGIDNVIVERYDEFLEKVINNPYDPRGYHGEWSDEGWKCPECGEKADLNEREKRIECSECGENSKLAPIQRQNLAPEEWTVPKSCGALKVEPLKKFVEEHGFDVMITGIRGSDMIAQSEDGEAELIEEKEEPVEYTRINPLKNWSEENVWAYLKQESVSYPVLYDQGYRHTDSKCCTSDEQGEASEYGEGGIDAEKQAAKKELQDMGYI